jgi:hypothetical protein
LIKWAKYISHHASEAEVREWFEQFPAAQVGIVTGSVSDLVVVDVEAGGSCDGLPPTVMARTAGGGWHFYYKHPGGEFRNSVKKIREMIDVRSDGGFVVAPPSYSSKYNKFYEWVTAPSDAALIDLPEWVIKSNHSLNTVSLKLSQPSQDKVFEKRRNSTATQVAGKLLHDLQSDQWETAGWPILKNWNIQTCVPPLEEKELRTVWESIRAREIQDRENRPWRPEDINNGPVTSQWRIWTPGDILNEHFGNDDWLIENLLLQPGLMVLSGNPGHFKTAIALHFALSVSRGTPVFDSFRTQQANVLMIDEENNLRHIKKRFESMGIQESDQVWYVSQNGTKIDNPEHLHKILALIKQHDIKFVTMDSLVDLHEQEENDSGGMQKVMAPLRMIVKEGVSVLFLHHPTKQQGFGPRKSGQGLRGSSNILAQVDCHLHVEKKSGEDNLIFRHEKMRDSFQLDPFEVKISFEGKAVTGFSFMFNHDEAKLKADEVLATILEILGQEELISRPYLLEMNIAGHNAIDTALKNGLTRQLIEKVPEGERPPEYKNRDYYRLLPKEDLPKQPDQLS